MALPDLSMFSKKVEFSGSTFTVRGLSLQDITKMFHANPDAVNNFYKLFVESQGTEFSKLAPELVQTAPTVVAQMIALAADDTPENAAKLPITLQILLVEQIGVATFDSVDLGKVLGVLTGMAESLASAVNKVQASESGIGA